MIIHHLKGFKQDLNTILIYYQLKWFVWHLQIIIQLFLYSADVE